MQNNEDIIAELRELLEILDKQGFVFPAIKIAEAIELLIQNEPDEE